ncbi:MAG: hypothetical protein LBP33_00875 [Candidatus Adiutrix sp.]|jgi:integrase|nr:hypothetical protein [Candidatus Adiutrix sp.]
MKGSIHSDQLCPICGSRFQSVEPKGLFCPKHKRQSPSRFVVRYDQITKRFDNYPAALQFLTGLRYQEGSGQFDARDYQIKAKPLSFDRLAAEWLEVKARTLKHQSMEPLRLAMRRAGKVWGCSNIKSIGYAQIEDLIGSLEAFSMKSKKHTLDALKQLWMWAADRYDIPRLEKWPKIGHVEMAFRNTVDLEVQESIISNIKEHEPFRVWLCIKWLATYIAIRPGEMRGLTEGNVDRNRGVLIVPDSKAKEKRAKIIPLIQEDMELIRNLPLAFNPVMPFFRHEQANGGAYIGRGFGHSVIYSAWRRACTRLGVEGVSLYPGTKHSTAMGLRAVATPEEIKSMTLHSTSTAFHRYFQTGGEALRELQSRRKSIITPDNGLITKTAAPGPGQIIEFSK